MSLLYLVRHGQTEYNANKIVQGHCDSPLTDLGVKQVKETAAKLKDIEFSICYHSPLGRTVKTSELILEHRDITKIPKDNLKEINLGTLEGKNFFDVKYATEFELFWRYPEKYTAESNNGETYDALEKRIYECCKEIAGNHGKDESILIVSHGAAIRSFLNPLINKPRNSFWSEPDVSPASISIVEWNPDSKPKLISYAGHAANTLTTNRN